MSDAASPSAAVRSIAAAAWAFRWQVEREAEARFERLADRLEAQAASRHLAVLARRAAADERRHAAHCARLAAELGRDVPPAAPPAPSDVAPATLAEEDAVTYELVAACAVTESVSVAVLTTLLPAAAHDPSLHAVLRELAEDEVVHARLGWAQLAIAAARGHTDFLGPLLPAMLQGSVDDDLFQAVEPAREDEGLLALGVLPHAQKRALFVRALEQVVFPGLEGAGVDTDRGRHWLTAALGASSTWPVADRRPSS